MAEAYCRFLVFIHTMANRFPHYVIPAKAGIQAVFEAVSGSCLAPRFTGLGRDDELRHSLFRRGDEIKTWVKLNTGVEMSACPNKRSRLKAKEATPSEWVRFLSACVILDKGTGRVGNDPPRKRSFLERNIPENHPITL